MATTTRSTVVAVSKREGLRGVRIREAIDGYLFILPWAIGFLVFTAFPMVFSLVLTVMNWEILSPPSFIGLANFQRMFTRDPLFPVSLYNTAYYTFIAVPLHILGALLLAMAVNVKIRGQNIYRTLYYLPTITPSVASALLWIWIFNPQFGIANFVLETLHLPALKWIFDPDWSKPSFILMSMWGIGGGMIIFLAGLQGIPEHLYEAANMDGANAWHRFRHITLPMLTPVIFFNLIIGIIGSFQVFTAAFVMTGGGPENSTLFYVLYLFNQAFTYMRMGYASALAWVLFTIIMIFTLIQTKMSSLWVFYEGGLRR